MREIYAKLALSKIPRLLGLIDRNKYSPTYGCFDRNYWHYKIIDFPSGMYQVGVLPLALVYSNDFPGNRFYKNERIKDLVIAGIKFMQRASHKDSSTDEFYPYERAFGATVISLYTATESYLLLNLQDESIEKFFIKKAEWILKNTEKANIANHQACAALALLNVYKITKMRKYLAGAKAKIRKTLSLQTNEGWFYEYAGCDPGYLTLTIDFLAKYYKKTKDEDILHSIKKAIDFCSYFIHPDGSYAGEYGSRSTYHFLPDGFEILGKKFPVATQITDKWLDGVKNQKREFMEDDRYFIYDTASWLQAYLDFNENRKGKLERTGFKKYFPRAKIFVAKDGQYYVIVSLAKGGVLKVFRNDKNIYSDCGLIGVLDNGKTIVTQVIDNYPVHLNENITVEGNFNSVKNELPTPSKFILFRLGLLSSGRSQKLSKMIKNALTKRLILSKNKENVRFKRTFEIKNGVKITDEIELLGKENIKSLAIGSDHSVIHTPGSRYYQESVLNPWINLDKYVEKLNKDRKIEITRVIE